MGRVMLAIICLMLCCGLGEALVCYVCKVFKPGGPCIFGKGFCKAKIGQECTEVHVYPVAESIHYRFGCASERDICDNAKVESNYGTFKTKCCKSKDYCNAPPKPG